MRHLSYELLHIRHFISAMAVDIAVTIPQSNFNEEMLIYLSNNPTEYL